MTRVCLIFLKWFEIPLLETRLNRLWVVKLQDVTQRDQVNRNASGRIQYV